MKKISVCLALLVLLLTSCANRLPDISKTTSATLPQPSDAQIYDLCEDGENWYYCEETSLGTEIYQQSKRDYKKTLIRRESSMRNLVVTENWLYFDSVMEQNVCRIRRNGEDCSVVFSYKSLQKYENEPSFGLWVIDNTIFIQMSFGFYRYNLETLKMDEIYYDARTVDVLGEDIYFSGRECTIYKMNVYGKEPQVLFESEMNGDDQDKWKNLYKNFIVVGDVMCYYMRSPDGLYCYQNEESKLIDNSPGIDEVTLFEQDGKLYYIIHCDEGVKLMQYNPQKEKVVEIFNCSDYKSDAKIRNGYFYYQDFNDEKQKVQMPY